MATTQWFVVPNGMHPVFQEFDVATSGVKLPTSQFPLHANMDGDEANLDPMTVLVTHAVPWKDLSPSSHGSFEPLQGSAGHSGPLRASFLTYWRGADGHHYQREVLFGDHQMNALFEMFEQEEFGGLYLWESLSCL